MKLRNQLAGSAAILALLQGATLLPAKAQMVSAADATLDPISPAPAVAKNKNKPVQLADAAPPSGQPNAETGTSQLPAAASAEQITVTGSRLKRTNLESISPVVTVTSADIQAKGLTQTADVINQLPQAGIATVSNANSNFSTDAAGLQIINLRNLGSDRTLVLIDGRRTVGGLPPGQGTTGNSSGVDISTIPAYLIDKIDVVTGGESTQYGSEAVAGVVNIRLKQHFNGFMLNQQYGGTSGNGDSRTTTTDLLVGSDFADDRGHALFAAEYQDQGAVYSRDRPFSAYDINNLSGVPLPSAGITNYGPSSFIVDGRIATTKGNYVTLGGDAIAPYSAATYGFNREALRTIQIPTTQLDTYSKLSYDITPDVTVFTDFKFARTTATSLLEPIAIGAGVGNQATTIGFNGDYLNIPASNPYLPASLQGIVKTDADGNIYDFRHRFLQLGDRGSDVTRFNYAFTTGFKGELLNRFNWETYYSYSQTTSNQVESNAGNVLNLQNSLNADRDPATGAIQCADASARAAGCVPLNFFGPNSGSAAALSYIRAIKTYDDNLSQSDFEADIGGPIVKLPYGDLELSIGYEHRREDGSSTPDALTASGYSLDSSGPATRGGYSVNDLFAETKIPVLKDLPFAKSLTLDASYRRSYYSLTAVGAQESYNYGVTYAPVPDVLFRAQNAVAIRAPTVSDLYTGRTQSALGVIDPCSSDGLASAANTAARIAGCSKIPGITPGFAEDQAHRQTEISYNTGNPNLNAERARVLTYGFVLQPRYIPRASVSVDAFKYLIANALGSVDLQTAANQCVDTGNAAFCDLVRRDPATGLINGVDSASINVGAIREQGIDVQASYEVRLPSVAHYIFRNVDDIGAIDFNWNYEHITHFNQINFGGAITEEAGDLGAPKNKWTFDALYRDQKLQLNLQVRYIGQENYDVTSIGDPHFANRFYSDMSIRYQVANWVAVYGGIRNMFDRQPPQIDQNYQQTGAGVASGVTGTNTVPDQYDTIGRYIYAGVNVKL